MKREIRVYVAAVFYTIVSIAAIVMTVFAGSISTAQVPLNVAEKRFNQHSDAVAFVKKDKDGGEASQSESTDGPSQEQYDNRAFPATHIESKERENAFQSFLSVNKLSGGKKNNWQEVGPINPLVVAESTYTGRPTYNSGRITALALSPKCQSNDCKILVGAAGGGVWTADNALAAQPNWHPIGSDIPSNAIGSIFYDPNDAKGNTLYVGTGEPNGSSDSEAGVGLYRSVDGGKTFKVVEGSVAIAAGRSIGAVAVDPGDPKHIFIGTAVARHGSSSVNGGRYTPPSAAAVGLYESTDNGDSFKLAFQKPADVVNPGSANGSDFFRGGVTNIQFSNRTVYFAMMDYGLYRANGAGGYEQIFVSAGGGSIANSAGSRTEFSLAPLANGDLRIYVGDTDGGPANFFRTDKANVAAASINWVTLSSSTAGTPGFGSYNYCGGQCSYDMPVYSPSGAPDIVYIGGQMQYTELFGSSNGRTVQRSSDAGVHFTDMTDDTQSPPLGMHPDQHAIVAVPGNPNLVFFGSDGGLVRIDGQFSNASTACDTRGLSATDLTDCHTWLSAIPHQLISLNKGLATLQFQSVSVNPQNPLKDIMGGTQDNGSWAYNGQGTGNWFETIGGDGGQSGVDAVNPNIRFHNYYNASPDINFHGTDPLGWNWIADPIYGTEPQSFYVPMIPDPKVSGTLFVGSSHVWRTQDSGGPQAYLEQHCNEYFGDFTVQCGDWVALGDPSANGRLYSTAYGADKGTTAGYVSAVVRATGDTGTLWTGTRRGRLFISKNADVADPTKVIFTRIDTAATPTRFISGIAVDPANPNHAFVSFSGYNAYALAAGTTAGHVFEVTYNPTTKTAAWKDISYNIGDQPVTSVALFATNGELYIGTDFGVAVLLPGEKDWVPAAGNLPAATVYGLTLDSNAKVLYAATHGRGVWKLDLSK